MTHRTHPMQRALLGLLVLIGSEVLAFGSDRPNIILVVTDDQGYGPVGRHGHPWIETPHLDALHDRSVRFERFLVSPTCAPTRSALMTGRHPMRNGVTHTILERERMTLEATTLPELLKGAGYTSAIFGKWHLGDEDPYQPQNRGFDEVFIHGAGGIGQAYRCSCADAPGNLYFDPVIRYNGAFVQTRGFCTDVFFSAALDWIEEAKESETPFFAYIATNAPHGPFIAPPESRARFEAMGFSKETAGFYGMIENIDQNMGRLADRLAAWDLTGDTVVIFMSDNGMTGAGAGSGILGRTAEGAELAMDNAGMRGLKGSADEGGVRVPLFVSWEGHFEPGRQVDEVCAHIDLLPTLAQIAGVDAMEDSYPAAQVEGRSLLPLLSADQTVTWPDRYLFTHQGRWPTGTDPNEHKFKGYAVRSARFRFVNGDALYDMLADPGQKENVLDQHPEVVADMRAAYDAWWAKTVPMMVNESAPLSKTRPFHLAHEAQLAQGGIPEWRASMPDRSEDAVQLVGRTQHVMVPEVEGESGWRFEDGVLTASPGWDSVITPESYQDFRMHVEFNVNDAPGKDHEANGNSGVYIQQRYELQILNSFGISEADYQASDCGSLYRLKKPDRLACRPAGEWQSFDILFRAARFAPASVGGETKTEDARIRCSTTAR
ncbi:Arylsulfatase [Planctomycetes bacterium Poly30]|uniref:Arylsulfatase n=1 Tax=Saltatorellus ferox TaxID=2528018 RepID=A0A518ELT1_9BACT|nr:Arylsulfatase [Planctomycetes bacterium Poly30]